MSAKGGPVLPAINFLLSAVKLPQNIAVIRGSWIPAVPGRTCSSSDCASSGM